MKKGDLLNRKTYSRIQIREYYSPEPRATCLNWYGDDEDVGIIFDGKSLMTFVDRTESYMCIQVMP